MSTHAQYKSVFWSQSGGVLLFLLKWMIRNHDVSTNALTRVSRRVASAVRLAKAHVVVFAHNATQFDAGLCYSCDGIDCQLYRNRLDRLVKKQNWADCEHTQRFYDDTPFSVSVYRCNRVLLTNWSYNSGRHDATFRCNFNDTNANLTIFALCSLRADELINICSLPDIPSVFGHGMGDVVHISCHSEWTSSKFSKVYYDVVVQYERCTALTVQQKRFLYLQALEHLCRFVTEHAETTNECRGREDDK